MEVIHIFGASGSGVSTLGRAVESVLGYRQLDTDDYFWQPTDPPYTVKRETARRKELMLRDMQELDKCVVTGSMLGWSDFLEPLMTLAVYMYTPREVRLERLRQREREELGERLLPGGDFHDNHQEFLAWAAAYDTGGEGVGRNRLAHEDWMGTLTCPVLRLSGEDSPEGNVERIRAALAP